MAIYKNVEPLEIVIYQGGNEDFDRGAKFILKKLDALPTADVVEVKHGEWIEGKTLEKCSVCGKKGFPDWHYCSHCGAKMDGERKCDNG